MTIAVDAVYEDGVLKPEHPLALKDKTKVRLVIEAEAPPAEDDDPTGWKTAESFIGIIPNAPQGVSIAQDHDEYLD